jgi:hypothetical protein
VHVRGNGVRIETGFHQRCGKTEMEAAAAVADIKLDTALAGLE